MVTSARAIRTILSQRAMLRRLVVEMKAVALVPDQMDAGRDIGIATLAGRRRHRPAIVINRMGRVLRKGMQDVGQQQFLMLLLVMQPDLEDREKSQRAVVSSAISISRSTAASTCARYAATSCAFGRVISPRSGRA